MMKCLCYLTGLALLLMSCVSIARPEVKVIHAFVALCDNDSQGIARVPDKIGNGDDPGNNLYWGALYGLKTTFKKSADWHLIHSQKPVDKSVLERLVFQYREQPVFLVADAYRGKEIVKAFEDVMASSAGTLAVSVKTDSGQIIEAGKSSDLLVYVGHDVLMDFWDTDILFKRLFSTYPEVQESGSKKEMVILACQSKKYFADALKKAGGFPLVWTRSNLAPESYILEAVLAGWVRDEKGDKLVNRAATAYAKYQKISVKSAKTIFATGW